MKIRVLQVFEIIAMFAKGIEYTLHMSELDIIVLVKVYTCPSWSKLTKKKKVTQNGQKLFFLKNNTGTAFLTSSCISDMKIISFGEKKLSSDIEGI